MTASLAVAGPNLMGPIRGEALHVGPRVVLRGGGDDAERAWNLAYMAWRGAIFVVYS